MEMGIFLPQIFYFRIILTIQKLINLLTNLKIIITNIPKN